MLEVVNVFRVHVALVYCEEFFVSRRVQCLFALVSAVDMGTNSTQGHLKTTKPVHFVHYTAVKVFTVGKNWQ